MGAALHTVTGYDSDTQEYKTTMRTGYMRGWDGRDERTQTLQLVRAGCLLLGAGTEAAREWGDVENKDVWVTYLTSMKRGGRQMLVAQRLDKGGEERKVTSLEGAREAMGSLGDTAPTREVRVREEMLGRAGWSTALEMHSAVHHFWMSTGQQRPEGVARRMDCNRTGDGGIPGAKRVKRQQGTITGTPMGVPGRSMLQGEQDTMQAQEAVRCRTEHGQGMEVQVCEAGRWELGRGKAIWRPHTGAAVSLELAKVMTWKMRARLSWGEMALEVQTDVIATEEAEGRGFRMPAWQLLTQVRQATGSTRLMGPTKAMADIHFASWTPGYEVTGGTSLTDTLVILDSMEEGQQWDLAARLRDGENWAVVASVDCLAPGILEELEERWPSQVILPAINGPKRPERQPKVYAKGWWKTGSKRICRSKGEMCIWRGDGGGVQLIGAVATVAERLAETG